MNNTYKSACCDSSHLDRSFNSISSIFFHLRHSKEHLHIRRDNNKHTSTVSFAPEWHLHTETTGTVAWEDEGQHILTCRLRNNLVLPQQGSHRWAGLIQRLWGMFQREDRIQIPPCKSKAAFLLINIPSIGPGREQKTWRRTEWVKQGGKKQGLGRMVDRLRLGVELTHSFNPHILPLSTT